jgi:hypothetical protein
MDNSQPPDKVRETFRPGPIQPPSPSKSSTTSSQPRRQTPSANSANSSSSQLDHSSRLSQAPHQHRFHHAHCSSPATSGRDRPRPRPRSSRESRDSRESRESRETPDDLRSPPTPAPTSTLLQERLQRERRVESERSSSRMSGETHGYTNDARAVHSSPAHTSSVDGRRPTSSHGGDPLKKKGLGLKEMEQVIGMISNPTSWRALTGYSFPADTFDPAQTELRSQT